MANGYCPALLKTIESIAGENAPSRKLHVAGFLAMTFCCQNSMASPLQDASGPDGQQKTVTVSYTQRPVLSMVQDEDDCDINNLPTKSEWSLGPWRHKQSSFFISDDLIQRYCAEYAEMMRTGSPASPLQRQHYDEVLSHANIVLKAINRDLVTVAGTQFGINVVTHSAAARGRRQRQLELHTAWGPGWGAWGLLEWCQGVSWGCGVGLLDLRCSPLAVGGEHGLYWNQALPSVRGEHLRTGQQRPSDQLLAVSVYNSAHTTDNQASATLNRAMMSSRPSRVLGSAGSPMSTSLARLLAAAVRLSCALLSCITVRCVWVFLMAGFLRSLNAGDFGFKVKDRIQER